MHKEMFNANQEDKRKRERLELRWKDEVGNSAEVLTERNWKTLARNRQMW
jgi:hypothetical protein